MYEPGKDEELDFLKLFVRLVLRQRTDERFASEEMKPNEADRSGRSPQAQQIHTLIKSTSTAGSPLAHRLYLRLCRSYIFTGNGNGQTAVPKSCSGCSFRKNEELPIFHICAENQPSGSLSLPLALPFNPIPSLSLPVCVCACTRFCVCKSASWSLSTRHHFSPDCAPEMQ